MAIPTEEKIEEVVDQELDDAADADRRGCVRIGLSGFPCDVILSDGASTMQVECVNQSAEGFGIKSSDKLPWTTGQKLLLNNGGLWHEVKIVYIDQQDDDQHRVGLVRLGDRSDYTGPSPLRLLWGEIKKLFGFGFARNMQILGFGSAFLLCMVVLFLVLHPTSPMKKGSDPLSVIFSPIEKDGYQPTRRRASMRTGIRQVADKKDEAPKLDSRVSKLLSDAKEITWNDLEGALGLNSDQSLQLLAMLRGAPSDGPDDLDTSKIVIDSQKDFAAFLSSFPEKAFEFLTKDQQESLQSMLKAMSQP